MEKVKLELLELGTIERTQENVKCLRMAKEAMERANRMQMESIQLYKDLNEMVNASDANKNFKKVTLGTSLIVLPHKKLKNFLVDQVYGYRTVTTIRSGVLP